MKLGKVCKLKRGNVITEKQSKLGEYPVISGGQTPAYYHNEYNREGNIITIAGSGVYAGYIAYWDKPIFVSDAFSIQGIKDILNTKYVYYFLKTKQYKIYNMKTGAGIPHIYISDIEKITIPIPSIAIQNYIVSILDSFQTYIADVEGLLPREIELRQKQYEYYREKLLNFRR